MGTPNKFVFVVCGAREHIDTLHFSLRYLKHFSKNDIIIVTDPTRNEIAIEHDSVVDVSTPEHFTHHQASIYLKTGLHKFLPKGFNYCYLDTDVVALTEECDNIFAEKSGVVNFAPDHCRMPRFSPHAVKCDCLVQNRKEIAEIEALMEQYDPARKLKDPVMEKKKMNLIRKFEIMKQNKLSYALISLRFITTLHKFKLDDDTYYDRWKKVWHDKEGRVIITPAESMVKDIEKNSQWRWNSFKRKWYGPDGKDIFNLECEHLPEYIHNRFDIDVRDKNFQHWNGGVFLFDDSSHDFLEAWFNKTMKIFEYKEWMTRDQGTLIATVWEFGLQDNKMLPKKFNFIADWNNPRMMFDEQGNFTDDAFKTKVRPAFIHIYHNFGKKGWDVWDYVENIQSAFSGPPVKA
ncbi:MAG TPA: hypothetical protein VG603_10780 [Chitinophagales bacterium]|nr:hypothetical protein [Chitinophagales bacterium]